MGLHHGHRAVALGCKFSDHVRGDAGSDACAVPKDSLMTDESHLCECGRPDELDNPHRHNFDWACVYWIAGEPSIEGINRVIEGRQK